eukprot:7390447-Prymnesium_polylepis.1
MSEKAETTALLACLGCGCVGSCPPLRSYRCVACGRLIQSSRVEKPLSLHRVLSTDEWNSLPPVPSVPKTDQGAARARTRPF